MMDLGPGLPRRYGFGPMPADRGVGAPSVVLAPWAAAGLNVMTGEPIVTLASIRRLICRGFAISDADLISMRRTKDLMLPRHITCYLAREMTMLTLPQIGREINGRDHTTIHNSIRAIQRLRSDAAFDEYMDRIIAAVGSNTCKPREFIIAAPYNAPPPIWDRMPDGDREQYCQLMRRAGLSWRVVAEKVDVSRDTVQRFMAGRQEGVSP